MRSPSLNRRSLMKAAGVTAVAAIGATVVGRSVAQASLAPVRPDIGVSTFPFDLGQVQLTASRWLDNQNRTLTYLRFVDVDRLLYNFRANHRLSTNGAAATGGWDAPNFPFRTHMQGHFLSAWAQAYAVLGDTTCRDKANHMVAELARTQIVWVPAGPRHSSSPLGTTPTACTVRRPSPHSAASARSRHLPASPNGIASTEGVTGRPTAPSTPSP